MSLPNTQGDLPPDEKQVRESTNDLFKTAVLKNFAYDFLVHIIDVCTDAHNSEEDVLKRFFNRKRIITLFVNIYRESGNKDFYALICEVPFITRRDKRLILNARLHLLFKKVWWWQDWPFLFGNVSIIQHKNR